jgi:CO/xanthine dehydrogenase Mo-binding subunit
MKTNNTKMARRDLLKGGGVLIVEFALRGVSSAATAIGTAKPHKLELGPYGPPEDQLDSWLEITADGRVALFSGCSELGTGSSTALGQIVAEELDVPFERVKLTLPDTSRTPDQFVTSGSRTISIHSRPIRQASAEARAALVDLAAKRFNVSAEHIVTRNGIAMVRGAKNKQVTYGQLIGGKQFNLKVTNKIKPKSPKDYTIVGTSVKRWDIPGKVFGTFQYVQDVKVPGMLHGRVVRPPAHGASVVSINEQSVAKISGLVKVVRVVDLVGVVCQREEQAIAAARALEVKWSDWAELPNMEDLHKTIRNLPEFPSGYPKDVPGGVLAKKGDVETGIRQAAEVVEATYYSAFNHHGSIGPSCAVADYRTDGVTIWCGTQTPYGTREAVAKFLGMTNDKVRLIFAEASGCYGQNGADDVVIDALVLSRAVGKPVRVQWSRADENGWESYKAARVSECRAGLDANGKIVAWDAQTWGQSGYSRPGYHEPKHGGEPGSLVTAQLAGWDKPGLEEGFSGAAGNFIPVYDDIPNKRVVFTYLGPASHRQGPLRIRVGSMRGVGSPDNIFVAECFMDELAAAAGMDALEFRLKHLPFDRGVSCLNTAAQRAKWQTRVSHSQPSSGDIARGRGVALVGTDTETSVAGIYEVEVNRKTGVVRVPRVVIAHDCGLVVNPGAVRNQIEGGVIQSLSRALKEEVKFDRSRVTSLDWVSYPIIKFDEIPDEIDIVLLDRPDLPPMRVGEPASETVWPGVANAIYDAIGVRLRQLPFTPERVLRELNQPQD